MAYKRPADAALRPHRHAVGRCNCLSKIIALRVAVEIHASVGSRERVCDDPLIFGVARTIAVRIVIEILGWPPVGDFVLKPRAPVQRVPHVLVIPVARTAVARRGHTGKDYPGVAQDLGAALGFRSSAARAQATIFSGARHGLGTNLRPAAPWRWVRPLSPRECVRGRLAAQELKGERNIFRHPATICTP